MTEAATVYDQLKSSAQHFGSRPFLRVLPETALAYGIAAEDITYETLLTSVERRKAEFADAGFKSGDRVGLLVENRPEFFQHWFALNGLGVSVVPINPDLKSQELQYLIQHSEMIAAVVMSKWQDDVAAAALEADIRIPVFGPADRIPRLGLRRLTELPPSTRDTECALLYTSGTTGRPKGCVLTNTYFLNSGSWYLRVGGLIQLNPGTEVMLTPLPLFHMNAMATSSMTMLMSGGCLVVLDRFHPKTWWDSVRAARASIVHYLGVMPPILMSAPESASDPDHSVKFGFGAGVDRRLHAAFESRFGFPLLEAWAMTETGGGVVIAASTEPRHVGKSCFGRPGPESEIRVVTDDGRNAGPDEPGELLVRRAGADPKHGFFREYLKDTEATAEAWADGWFHTGDVIRRDAEGFCYFVDRKKNVIRRSGENIAAVEVESVLLQHPNVLAAGVSAVPDDVRGEEVLACIVTRATMDLSARAKVAQSIVEHCLERLAYYKAPGYVVFVDALPLTSTQKIQRGKLKTLAAELPGKPQTIDTRALKKRNG
jgi:acyl-CoA synthetase (AMP-forming)/AMP-acid ligase II